MRKADNLPPSCAVVTKSGNLNFPEPSGPLRACSGTALPLYIYIYIEESNREVSHLTSLWFALCSLGLGYLLYVIEVL